MQPETSVAFEKRGFHVGAAAAKFCRGRQSNMVLLMRVFTLILPLAAMIGLYR